jgi:hypothetical protein
LSYVNGDSNKAEVVPKLTKASDSLADLDAKYNMAQSPAPPPAQSLWLDVGKSNEDFQPKLKHRGYESRPKVMRGKVSRKKDG